jgi:hypothetical protein
MIAKPTRKAAARDVFAFFISGAKERAPAAARHFISLLAGAPARKRPAPAKRAPASASKRRKRK